MKTLLKTALWLTACLIALGAGLGCGERGSSAGAREPKASGAATGDVLKVIDSIAVRTDDLRALQAAGQLSARDALARLEAEALLMAEAERRGYGARPAVRRVTDQALAQAYVDARAAEVSVPAQEVAAAYAQQDARFHQGERRAFVHALAPLPADREPTAQEETIARTFAEQLTAALMSPGVDPLRLLQGVNKRPLAYQNARVENVPAMPREKLVKPFADALFAATSAGPLPAAVRTMYGWHAVVLTEVLPPINMSLEQATPELTAELLLEARTAALTGQLAELRNAQQVEFSPEYRQRLEIPQFDE